MDKKITGLSVYRMVSVIAICLIGLLLIVDIVAEQGMDSHSLIPLLVISAMNLMISFGVLKNKK